MNMSLVLCLPLKIHLSRSSSNVPRLPSFLDMLQNPHGFTHFWQGAQSLSPATQNDASRSKSGASMWYFSHLDFEMCFFRHNGVHFFIISTSKSGPSMVSFVHFDLEMCYPPQRRALFHHLNFQKMLQT